MMKETFDGDIGELMKQIYFEDEKGNNQLHQPKVEKKSDLILKSRFNKVTVGNTYNTGKEDESPRSPTSNQRTPITLAVNKKDSMKILSNEDVDPEIDIRKSALENN